jgi:hypothetical protein
MEPPDGLKIIKVTSGWAMGEYEHCLAMVWKDQPDIEAFQIRTQELLDLSKRHPGKCALVEIVETTSKPPANETRRAGMDVFRKLGSDLSAIGFVVEGSEVRGALTRAIIVGMLFFVKQPQPTKVFKRPSDMVAWVRPLVQNTEPDFETQLMAALEHLRALMHAQAKSASA